MDDHERRIFALEAEMLALMGIVGEVFRRLAEISPQHQAAVRDGLDGASRTLSQAHEYALRADMRFMFDYALKSVEWLTLSALAPRAGGNTAHEPMQ